MFLPPRCPLCGLPGENAQSFDVGKGTEGPATSRLTFWQTILVDEATLCFLQRSRCSPWGWRGARWVRVTLLAQQRGLEAGASMKDCVAARAVPGSPLCPNSPEQKQCPQGTDNVP